MMNEHQIITLRNYAPEAADEIVRLRDLARVLWLVLKGSDGYTVEDSELQSYPGDDRAVIEHVRDQATKSVTFTAKSF